MRQQVNGKRRKKIQSIIYVIISKKKLLIFRVASILNVGVLSSSRIHKHTYRQSMWCNVMEWEEMKNSQALPRVDKAYWWLKFDTFLPVDWFFLMPCHFCGWRNLLINNDKHFHFRKKTWKISNLFYSLCQLILSKRQATFQKLLFSTHTHTTSSFTKQRLTFSSNKVQNFLTQFIYEINFFFKE